ncbi:carotenoid 9,10(9',10')-cleavage dioxygenase 1-like [Typha angustifolia]|uniref:carotenoid 9,10(9',10')-cleavage dioxygenase 1-like n=1 Tax=Typha angustifolia TaxID=59011 RepID=UPI003C2F4449
MASLYLSTGCTPRASMSPNANPSTTPVSSNPKPFFRELQQKVPVKIDVSKAIKKASQRLVDAFVDSTFQFIDQPLLPSRGNFAPVDEIGEAVRITNIEGEIPEDFPEGVYIRNGSNPQFGALHSAVSFLGRSSNIWVEGEGMLHALYFSKEPNTATWAISYNNRYIRSDTFVLEKARQKPCFIPAVEGDSPAILAAYILNLLRFGMVNKVISNTSVFEHAGKICAVAESHMPQEIDVSNLDTGSNWDVDGAWDRPFTAHPKRAPVSGELVIFGIDAKKPFLVLGVVSADGKRLKHKVDLQLDRCTLCHDIGVTGKYNIIMDIPLTIDMKRVVKGGPLIKFEKDSYSRIGVMPRYGSADSVKWFDVEQFCAFHIINCFECGDEVVVIGFRTADSVIPGPKMGVDEFQQFSRVFKSTAAKKQCSENGIHDRFFPRLHEWRLNMKTGGATGRYLTGFDFSAEFPVINDHYTGIYNNYAYGQVGQSKASSICVPAKFGGFAKFYLNEQVEKDGLIKVEQHKLGRNQFCSGATFVPRLTGSDEDDGWIISFVHDEENNTSQVYIIDASKFGSDPVAKITLPQRVPYGFHGTFISRAT